MNFPAVAGKEIEQQQKRNRRENGGQEAMNRSRVVRKAAASCPTDCMRAGRPCADVARQSHEMRVRSNAAWTFLVGTIERTTSRTRAAANPGVREINSIMTDRFSGRLAHWLVNTLTKRVEETKKH